MGPSVKAKSMTAVIPEVTNGLVVLAYSKKTLFQQRT